MIICNYNVLNWIRTIMSYHGLPKLREHIQGDSVSKHQTLLASKDFFDRKSNWN